MKGCGLANNQLAKTMKNLLSILPATGAYGRKYSCLADILIDYLDGKDFRVINGSYFSFRDADRLLADGYDHIEVDGWLVPVK